MCGANNRVWGAIVQNKKKNSSQAFQKIFISWSGPNSKLIAKGIKKAFEEIIFKDKVTCFVSDVDISSGSDWWNKIKGELRTSKYGIVCITKENVKAPWIYFEAGALIAREIPTIPLLVSCNYNSLNGSPLTGKQCVDFYDQLKFVKMVCDINSALNLIPLNAVQLEPIVINAYNTMKQDLAQVLHQLKNMRLFNEKYIYPNTISVVNKNTVFISAPMASIGNDAYQELRAEIFNIKEVLIEMGFSNVICPVLDIADTASFEGKTKAIKDNFTNLKQVDSMVVIYPQQLPSSILVEIGYGIALCKRMVIFYREKLPYILEDAGESIEHIKSFKFSQYSEITQQLRENGMAIFEGDNDD